MRIIIPGKIKDTTEETFECTCPYCECVFEYKLSDMTIEKRLYGKRSVECPWCHREIVIQEGKSRADFLI